MSGTKLRNISFKKSGKSHLARVHVLYQQKSIKCWDGSEAMYWVRVYIKGVTVSLHPATPFKKEVQ